MSKWDSVRPGKPVIDALERSIAENRAYNQRQNAHYIAIIIVAGLLVFVLAGGIG